MLVYDIIPPQKRHFPLTKRRSRILTRALTAFTLFAILFQAATGLFGAPKEIKAAGITYYVDCNAANDSGAGTSPGTAWKTIAKVNSSSFSPGDSILFNKGCTWREQLTVPSSGSAGNPITFGAYGSGTNPIISGANLISTSWTPATLIEESGGLFTSGLETETSTFTTAFTGKVETGGNALTVQSSIKNSGTKAGLITYAGTSPSALASKVLTTQPNMYARMYFYAHAYSMANYSGAEMFSIRNSADYLLRFFLSYNAGNLSYSVQDYAGAVFIKSENWSGDLTPDAWHYVELGWQKGSGASGTSTVWMDGTLVGTATIDHSGVGNPDRVWVGGSVGTTPHASSLVYFDDVKVDTSHIGALAPLATVYYTAAASKPNQVFSDGNRLISVATESGMGLNDWWWDSSNSRIYVRLSTDDAPSGHTMEVGTRASAIYTTGKSYLTFQNLIAEKSEGQAAGIELDSGSSHITLDGVESRKHFTYGLFTYGNGVADSNIEIRNSTFDLNGGTGIQIGPTSPNIWIHNNTINNNCWNGQVTLVALGGIYVESLVGTSDTGNVIVEYNVSVRGNTRLTD